MSRKLTDVEKTVVGVIIVIFIIILFIITFGNFDADDFSKIPNEFKDTKEQAKDRHKKLFNLLERQKALKLRLEQKFKTIYLFVRIGLVLIWSGLIFLYCLLTNTHELGAILDFSQASIIVLLALNFITFGNITNLNEFVDSLKTKTENWIYGKYINIDDKIAKNHSELKSLEEVIKEPETSRSRNSPMKDLKEELKNTIEHKVDTQK